MVYIFTFAPTRNIFFKTDEQRTVCNNSLLAVDLSKAFHLLTENGRPRPTKSRPRVKCSGFNFARGSESPFETRFAQSFGFACRTSCTVLSLTASLVSSKSCLVTSAKHEQSIKTNNGVSAFRKCYFIYDYCIT